MNRSAFSTIRAALRSTSEQHTLAYAKAMAQRLQPGDIVALEGPLGSGKTHFVRGLAEGLGIDPARVSSPTFVICQEYAPAAAGKGKGKAPAADRSPMTLVHIDAYRLNGAEELETIGWHELLASDDVVLAVEWPSRLGEALPERHIAISFEHLGEHARFLTIATPAELADRVPDPAPFEKAAGTAHTPQRQHRCRTCGRAIDESVPTYPFCSDRCRLADLGRWFNESYRTTRPVEADDELTE